MVEWKKLGEVCEVLDSQRKPISKDKRILGIYPYYGANGIQDYVDGYIFDGTYLLVGEDGSVINKDNSPVLHWVSGQFWVNNHAHILSETNNTANLRYLYYILQTIDVSDIVRGVPPKLNQANLKNISIPLPSPSEQSRIVSILDTFTASIANLKEQIGERRKQYEHYRNQLLQLEGKEGVEMKTLVSVANVQYGFPFNSSLFTEDQRHIPLIRIRDIKPAHASTYYSGEVLSEYVVRRGDILVGMDGEFNLEKWNDRDGLLNQRVLRIQGKKDICLDGYIYHYLGPVFKEIEKKTAGGSVKHLSAKVVNSIKIPLPSLSEQSRIVNILDQFKASIANLEAQLQEREKQYEHYRNQLLTFE